MAEIGAYDAKRHLPKLLKRVEKGERFVITRRGRPVAELVPFPVHDAARVRESLAALRAMRKKLAERGVALNSILGEDEGVRDLVHAGHR